MSKALCLKSDNVIAVPRSKFEDVQKSGHEGKLQKESGDERDKILLKTVKDEFKVFEDPDPVRESEEASDRNEGGNNMIHELEKMLEERVREQPHPMENKNVGGVFITPKRWFKKRKPKVSEMSKTSRDAWMFASEDYFFDMFRYMMRRQKKFRISSNYLSEQKEVSVEMRIILIDWLYNVANEYNLRLETLHLSVSIIDRFMSLFVVSRDQFQLVGTTALMIATKCEEIQPPNIEEFAIITKNTYEVADIVRMERFILAELDFAVAPPTSIWFGNCFANRLNFTRKMKKSMQYLLILSFFETDCLRERPSTIAAAAVCFTNVQSGKIPWPMELRTVTGIHEQDFEEYVHVLNSLFIEAPEAEYRWVFTRYSEKDQDEVALMAPPTDKLRTLFPSTFQK